MNNDMIMKLREKLIKEKNEIEKTLNSIKENNNMTNTSEGGEISLIDNHPADNATETFDKEKSYALIDNEKSRLILINEAIQKIDNKNYGLCEICGTEIPEERLNFMPFSKTCIKCEEIYNQKNIRIKKTKEDFSSNILANNYKDTENINEIGYDGEDAWDDVKLSNKRIYKNSNSIINENVEQTDNISNQYYKNQLP